MNLVGTPSEPCPASDEVGRANAAMDQLEKIISRLDKGEGLLAEEYLRIFEAHPNGGGGEGGLKLKQLNILAEMAPRVIVLDVDSLDRADVPTLVERHLMPMGRRSVVLLLSGSVPERKRRRSSTTADAAGRQYTGSGWGGRINFQFNNKKQPLIAKATGKWTGRSGPEKNVSILPDVPAPIGAFLSTG